MFPGLLNSESFRQKNSSVISQSMPIDQSNQELEEDPEMNKADYIDSNRPSPRLNNS